MAIRLSTDALVAVVMLWILFRKKVGAVHRLLLQVCRRYTDAASV
jgi:hypothetical protein